MGTLGSPVTVTCSCAPGAAVVAGGATWFADEKLASVIGDVDQRRSMFPLGSCPVHQSSPTSVHLTVAVPGVALGSIRSPSTVAGGRVSSPYKPVLRSS